MRKPITIDDIRRAQEMLNILPIPPIRLVDKYGLECEIYRVKNPFHPEHDVPAAVPKIWELEFKGIWSEKMTFTEFQSWKVNKINMNLKEYNAYVAKTARLLKKIGKFEERFAIIQKICGPMGKKGLNQLNEFDLELIQDWCRKYAAENGIELEKKKP